MNKLKWLLVLVLVLNLVGCNSNTSKTTQKYETVTGTIKAVTFREEGIAIPALVDLTFTDNSSVRFVYSGDQKILAQLLNLSEGQTVSIQLVRLEPYPMKDQYPTKDIVNIQIGKWPIN